jgi:integrase
VDKSRLTPERGDVWPRIYRKGHRRQLSRCRNSFQKVLKELRKFHERQDAEQRAWCVRHEGVYEPAQLDRVFSWRRKPVDDCNGAAFKNAVDRAGLPLLRWHDLRHAFASWALQAAVTLPELKELGGWKSYEWF